MCLVFTFQVSFYYQAIEECLVETQRTTKHTDCLSERLLNFSIFSHRIIYKVQSCHLVPLSSSSVIIKSSCCSTNKRPDEQSTLFCWLDSQDSTLTSEREVVVLGLGWALVIFSNFLRQFLSMCAQHTLIDYIHGWTVMPHRPTRPVGQAWIYVDVIYFLTKT